MLYLTKTAPFLKTLLQETASTYLDRNAARQNTAVLERSQLILQQLQQLQLLQPQQRSPIYLVSFLETLL